MTKTVKLSCNECGKDIEEYSDYSEVTHDTVTSKKGTQFEIERKIASIHRLDDGTGTDYHICADCQKEVLNNCVTKTFTRRPKPMIEPLMTLGEDGIPRPVK